MTHIYSINSIHITLYIYPLCFFLQPIVTQFGEELKGEERVVVDQLLSKLQCERLIELASVTKSTCSLRSKNFMIFCS